jgi:quercetin dioxygenase-like cupin family protein
MPIRLLREPTIIQAAGNIPKRIEEFVGVVNSETASVSIARMTSPAGWEEPPQTPEFDEYTVVLKGVLKVRTGEGEYTVEAGQAVIAPAGERVQYSTPDEAAEYIAICLPAFTPDAVHRD